MNSPKVVTLPALILAAILVSPSAVAQTMPTMSLQPLKVVTAAVGAAAADVANRTISRAVEVAADDGRLSSQGRSNNQAGEAATQGETPDDDDALRGLELSE